MKEKKNYSPAELEIIALTENDIIRTSGFEEDDPEEQKLPGFGV